MWLPGLMDVYGNIRFYTVSVKEENEYGTEYNPIPFFDFFSIEAVLYMDLETHQIDVYAVDRKMKSYIGDNRCFYDMTPGDELRLTIEYKKQTAISFNDYWVMRTLTL